MIIGILLLKLYHNVTDRQTDRHEKTYYHA